MLLVQQKQNDEEANHILPTSILQCIMDYLGPRELFNMAFLSKTLSGLVTTTMVVRSVLFSGGKGKRSFEQLYKLI